MISQGAKFSCPSELGYLTPPMEVAAKHPDVCDIHLPAQAVRQLHTFWAASDQQSYALGIAAGDDEKPTSSAYGRLPDLRALRDHVLDDA